MPYFVAAKTAEATPISTAVQLQHFLKQHHSFKPDQVVALYIGTNDVGNNFDLNNNPELARVLRDDKAPLEEVMTTERARVETAGKAAAKTAADILENGAKRLIVFKLARVGDLPWYRPKAARDYVNDLTAAYNTSLGSSLPDNPAIFNLMSSTYPAPSKISPAEKAGRMLARDAFGYLKTMLSISFMRAGLAASCRCWRKHQINGAFGRRCTGGHPFADN
ncbi:SGNH/GDSL hydrolase family protein [Mesorhizobium shangrilense]|uniref:SGNH/GDSL hydrolase family protein n=1 Tax=Mesorhizobium shangrilense TaxID=460060 RepID=A0ABV2DLK8_9HYPH